MAWMRIGRHIENGMRSGSCTLIMISPGIRIRLGTVVFVLAYVQRDRTISEDLNTYLTEKHCWGFVTFGAGTVRTYL
jgi:hypothetical protein